MTLFIYVLFSFILIPAVFYFLCRERYKESKLYTALIALAGLIPFLGLLIAVLLPIFKTPNIKS